MRWHLLPSQARWLSLIHGTYTVEGKDWLRKIVLWPSPLCTQVHLHKWDVHTQTFNKIVLISKKKTSFCILKILYNKTVKELKYIDIPVHRSLNCIRMAIYLWNYFLQNLLSFVLRGLQGLIMSWRWNTLIVNPELPCNLQYTEIQENWKDLTQFQHLLTGRFKTVWHSNKESYRYFKTELRIHKKKKPQLFWEDKLRNYIFVQQCC